MFGLLRHAAAFRVACVALGLVACSGEIESGDAPPMGSAGNSSIPRGGAASSAGGVPGRGGAGSTPSNSGGSGDPGGGAVSNGAVSNGAASTGGAGQGLPPANPDALIPARIRRLANAEYDQSARSLLGSALSPSIDYDFPPDARQAGFTVNDAQRVDPVVARQYATAAETLAASVKADVQRLAPCSDPNPGEACAKQFIESFGAKVYRRPLTAAEIDGPGENDGLLDLYRVGAEGASYADGIEQVIRGMLSSAGFLYLTEIGEGTSSPGTKVQLTPYELASSLSYIATAGPPSESLVASALAGELDTPEGRRQAMSALIDGAELPARVVRMVEEWLGIDRLGATAKDSNIYPGFDAVKAPLARETREFIAEVFGRSTGTVGELLNADYTYSSGMLEAPLAELYGVNAAQGRISLERRRGILNQGAFLSVFAHAHESSPVLRGVTIGRRLACLPIQSPSELNILVVPPLPDPSKSTRDRFAAHSQDAACAGCHRIIDPLGFVFESYDGMGRYREREVVLQGQTDGPVVDSHAVLGAGTWLDGDYADSDALVARLSESQEVRECFARHVFRGSIGRSDADVKAAEDEFVRYWKELWEAEDAALKSDSLQQGNLKRVLLSLVQNPLFSQRIVLP